MWANVERLPEAFSKSSNLVSSKVASVEFWAQGWLNLLESFIQQEEFLSKEVWEPIIPTTAGVQCHLWGQIMGAGWCFFSFHSTQCFHTASMSWEKGWRNFNTRKGQVLTFSFSTHDSRAWQPLEVGGIKGKKGRNSKEVCSLPLLPSLRDSGVVERDGEEAGKSSVCVGK